MSSKNRAFCLSLLRGVQSHTAEALAAEGILGMFLAAAHEYESMLFRSVALDTRTDFKGALDQALDTGNPLIQLIYHDQEVFSIKASNAPLSLTRAPELELGAGDVIVISGGAKGVTYRIARALAPFKPRIVLLGRTELDPAAAYSTLRNISGTAEKALPRLSKEKGFVAKGDQPDEETLKNLAGLNIARNVSRLCALGLKASYLCCDVADDARGLQTRPGGKASGRLESLPRRQKQRPAILCGTLFARGYPGQRRSGQLLCGKPIAFRTVALLGGLS